MCICNIYNVYIYIYVMLVSQDDKNHRVHALALNNESIMRYIYIYTYIFFDNICNKTKLYSQCYRRKFAPLQELFIFCSS